MFGSKAKEERQAAKLAAYMKKYNLENIDPKDLPIVQNIATDLAGSGLLDLGIALCGKAEDTAKLNYLSALVAQNWIIINQLSRLIEK